MIELEDPNHSLSQNSVIQTYLPVKLKKMKASASKNG
jgi:hypothetical protein